MNTYEKDLCEICLGEGSYQVRNGAEDFDYEFCNCPAGQRLQKESAQPVEAQFPISASAALDWFDTPSPFQV